MPGFSTKDIATSGGHAGNQSHDHCINSRHVAVAVCVAKEPPMCGHPTATESSDVASYCKRQHPYDNDQ